MPFKLIIITTLSTLITATCYAENTPPSLPNSAPALPASKVEKSVNNDSKPIKNDNKPKTTFSEKVRNFFWKDKKAERKPLTEEEKKALEEKLEKESFIDIGEHKLPAIKPLPEESVNLPKQGTANPPSVNTNDKTKNAGTAEIKSMNHEGADSNKIQQAQHTNSNSEAKPATMPPQSAPTVIQSNANKEIQQLPPATPSAAEPSTNKPLDSAAKAKQETITNQQLSNDQPKQSITAPQLSPLNERKSGFLPNHKLNRKHKHQLEQKNSYQNSPEQQQFVKDETDVLLLPDDDVNLGEISEQAKLDQLDYYSYIELYKKQQLNSKDSYKSHEIEEYINNYDRKYNSGEIFTQKEGVTSEAKESAFIAAEKNNISTLKVILDNYPLLQAKDENGYNLLQVASELNNYLAAKYLITRGINLSAKNYNQETALDIAEAEQNNYITKLLKKAGAKQD